MQRIGHVIQHHMWYMLTLHNKHAAAAAALLHALVLSRIEELRTNERE